MQGCVAIAQKKGDYNQAEKPRALGGDLSTGKRWDECQKGQ